MSRKRPPLGEEDEEAAGAEGGEGDGEETETELVEPVGLEKKRAPMCVSNVELDLMRWHKANTYF